jgi:phosphoribosylformimino-5-aminoimidazole carboxamide ribotide isomerase
MMLLPAIDLVDGRCVRLEQGDFAIETNYSDDPLAAVRAFAASGAEEVHIVDLDGAKAREPRQHDLLAELARNAAVKLQVAGGFRARDQVERMLDAGVERVVLGSLALEDPEAFAAILDGVGADRITLALDVRLESGVPMVATHGWLNASGRSLVDVVSQFPDCRHVLVTDIARDGMLAGPNVILMRQIVADFPHIALQASGGVATLEDLGHLNNAGAVRAIVGKAIWEGRFAVAEAIAHARG